MIVSDSRVKKENINEDINVATYINEVVVNFDSNDVIIL